MPPKYEEIKALNWSKLKQIEKSPAHFKAGLSDDTASLRTGIAVHCAILEPSKFELQYAVFQGKVRRGKEWEAFEFAATAAGQIVLNEREMTETLAIRDAVRNNPIAMSYLTGGQAEVAVTWEIPTVGPCKGRIDYLTQTHIVDLKTTQCSSPQAFGYSVMKYGYLGQAAWYRDGWARCSGQVLPFVFIAVESSAPYNVTTFTVSEEQLLQGQEHYIALLAKLDYCKTNNFWGGYSETAVALEIPNRSES